MDNTTNAQPAQGVSQMREVAGNTGQVGGRQGVHPEGLYRHPNGAELITQNDPLLGDAQGRAAERTGFVYVGPAPEGSVKTLGAPSLDHAEQPARAVEAQDAYNKGLEARLNVLEAERDALKNQVAAGTAVPGTEPVKGADETKQAAADKTAAQIGIPVDSKTGDVEQSHKDLQSEAKELGVNAKGSTDELKQRIAEAKAEKENK